MLQAAPGGPSPLFPVNSYDASSGYTLSTGGSASGSASGAMRVLFGDDTVGGSPGIQFTLVSPPTAAPSRSAERSVDSRARSRRRGPA